MMQTKIGYRWCVTFFALPFLYPVTFWLFNFCIRAPTGCLMLSPPKVSGWRCTIHCSLDKAKIGFLFLTRSITSPPMLLINFYLIMKVVVDLSGAKARKTIQQIQLINVYNIFYLQHFFILLWGKWNLFMMKNNCKI